MNKWVCYYNIDKKRIIKVSNYTVSQKFRRSNKITSMLFPWFQIISNNRIHFIVEVAQFRFISIE